jgi:hypothetical protein
MLTYGLMLIIMSKLIIMITRATPVLSGDPAFYSWPQSNFSPVCQISLLSFILAPMFPS